MGGIDINPKESVYISTGETKQVSVIINFDKKVLKERETLSFEYRVTGEKTGVTKDIFSVRVYSFETALSILSENLMLNQKEAKIYVKNLINFNFKDLDLKVSSEFFEDSFKLSLKPFEEKVFSVELDQDKLNRAVGGSYILSSSLTLGNVSGKALSTFNFEERTDISKEEKTSGFLVRKFYSKSINRGTMPGIVRVSVKKDWFGKILTTANIKPSDTENEGIYTWLIFEKELNPGEEFYVEVKTNYWIPVLFVILVAGGTWIFVYYAFKRRNLVIKKRVAMVKTKRGEFALKITLYIRARKTVEKVSVMDNIPQMVKLYDRFGILRPNRIDEVNRRVEWDFEVLNKDEERVVSYVIYSRLGVFGRFDLPEAAAVYEEGNEVYEVESNKVSLRFDNTSKSD